MITIVSILVRTFHLIITNKLAAKKKKLPLHCNLSKSLQLIYAYLGMKNNLYYHAETIQ